MCEFQHPFGRHPVDTYVSTEEGRDHYVDSDSGCSIDLNVDVRDILYTMVAILKHPDHSHHRDELREALGLPKEEK